MVQLLRDGNGRTRSSLIEAALEAARTHLDMDVSLLSEFQSGRQVYRHVSEAEDRPFQLQRDDGAELEDTSCERVVNGAHPHVISDAQGHPITKELPVTDAAGIGAYVGVPVRMTDGRLYGTLCCVNRQPDPSLRERDARFLAVLATIVGDELSRNEADRVRLARITSRIEAAMFRDELSHVFQPIVELSSGRTVGVEALARFAPDPKQSPSRRSPRRGRWGSASTSTSTRCASPCPTSTRSPSRSSSRSTPRPTPPPPPSSRPCCACRTPSASWSR